MKRALTILICLLAAVGARAQQQEQGLVERIDARSMAAIKAVNGSGKTDPALTSPLSKKGFTSGGFSTKSFGTGEFSGTKSAAIKTFETRSFLGINNPWFGRKVYETNADALGNRGAADSRKQFETDAFATKKFEKSTKPDLVDSEIQVPESAAPRPYLVAPKAQGGVDKFTQNLSKDLTIDDVRDLLNKGHGE